MKLATKSHSEWEDEEMEAVHGKPLPPTKPPRHDLRNHRLKKDYSDRNGDPDLKPLRKASFHRPGDVWETEEGKWRAKNPAGNSESFTDKGDARDYAHGKIEDIDEEDVKEDPEEEEKKPEAGFDDGSDEDAEEEEEEEEDDDPRKPTGTGKDSFRQAEKVIQDVFKSAKTFLPRDAQESLVSTLDYLEGKDRRKFLRQLRKSLDHHIQNNGFIHIARSAVNAVAGIEDFDEFSDPIKLAKKVALLAYGANVVANPKILGGAPVSRQAKTQEQLTQRSQEAYQHYKDLAEPWRLHAAKIIEKELKADPKGPRAKELQAILAGIAVAQVIKAGKGLPGHPEPSQGAIELFQKMAEDGQEELLFKPSEDFFVPENRTILRQALARVPTKDIPRLLMGDEDHPYKRLAEILSNSRIPGPLRTAVRTFMEEESLMSMTWKDRAFRDAMAETSRPMTPKERQAEMRKAEAHLAPEVADFLSGMEKVAEGGNPTQDEGAAMAAAQDTKGQSLLRATASKFVGWLGSAFSRKPQGSATAILKKYAETGDPGWLERPVDPHPDHVREKQASFSSYRNNRYRRHPATPERSTMSNIRITKRAANLVVGQLERAASIIQQNHTQLGIDVKVAFDFARRADMLSDFIDRKAGIDRKASRQKEAQGPAATISYDFDNFTETDLSSLDFDPSEIGEMSEGALMRDPDEPYMDAFNQDEYFQLAEVQQQGMFSNAKAASRRARK